jgi:NADH dehydrogenase FAD-containing subunit
MRVPGTPNVWALGDCALVPNAYDGKPSSSRRT